MGRGGGTATPVGRPGRFLAPWLEELRQRGAGVAGDVEQRVGVDPDRDRRDRAGDRDEADLELARAEAAARGAPAARRRGGGGGPGAAARPPAAAVRAARPVPPTPGSARPAPRRDGGRPL